MTKDDVLFGYRLQLFDLGRPHQRYARLPHVRGPPLDLLRAGTARSTPRARDAAPARAPPAADAKPALPMVEERIVASRSPTPGSGPSASPPSCGATSGARSWSPQRRLEGALPPRAEHRAKRSRSSPATGPYEPPRIPAPSSTSTSSARATGRHRLLLRRPAQGTEGSIWQLTAIDIASSFGWAELVVCQTGNPDRLPDLEARPTGRRGARGRRLAARALALRQRQRVQGPASTKTRHRSWRPPHPHPRRAPADQRPRRGAAQDDPRGVLAAGLRPLPASPLHRPAARARHLPRTTTTTTASTTAA